MEKPRFMHIVLSAVFFALLIFCGIYVFLFQRDVSEVENRGLAKLPAPNVEDVISCRWQDKFEDFVSDQMPLRDALASLYKSTKYLLGSRIIDGALVGADADGEPRLFEDPYGGVHRAEKLSETLEAISAFASSHGTEAAFLPVPPSSLVYGEDMPAHAEADEIRALYGEAAAENGALTVVPVLDAMLNAKKTEGESLYFRTDHHWTVRGAYEAYLVYCDIMGISPAASEFEVMSDDFLGTLHSKALLPFIEPEPLERGVSAAHLSFSVGSGFGGLDSVVPAGIYREDALGEKDKYAYFLGGNYGLALIENDALTEDAPTLFMLKDSFANCIVPYLASNYRRIVMVDPRYYRGTSSELASLIEAEAPSDILILYEITNLADDVSLRPLISGQSD